MGRRVRVPTCSVLDVVFLYGHTLSIEVSFSLDLLQPRDFTQPRNVEVQMTYHLNLVSTFLDKTWSVLNFFFAVCQTVRPR